MAEGRATVGMIEPEDERASSFPKAGLKASYVVGDFVTEVGGVDRLRGMTAEDVCQKVIKPRTLGQKCSYCDMLKSQGNLAYAAKADTFISHARSYLFLDFISALQWLLRDEPDTVVWIDLFSINQHEPMDWTFDWLSTTFKTAVQLMGRTIMVMSPWNNPLPFTRAWCVFEAYCTAVTDSKFEIAMSKTDEANFLESIRKYPDDRMNEVLATIRADQSQCSVESDKASIFSAIHSSVGFSKLDAMVFDRYRAWAIQVSLNALQALVDKKELPDEGNDGDGAGKETDIIIIEEAELLNALGRLYSRAGDYEKAEEYTKKSLETYTRALGEKHPSTLSLLNNTARILYVQGKYEEARGIFEACFEQRKEVLGEDDPDTLTTLNKLALTLCSLGKYDNARARYEMILDKRMRLLGPDHESTLKTMYHLANVLCHQGNHDEGEALARETYKRSATILGEVHPDTLRAMNGLASALDLHGKYEEAEELLTSCLERRRVMVGVDHPFTLQTLHRLAAVHANQGQVDKAQELFESCLEKRKDALGMDHPDTLSSLFALASLLDGQGQIEKAQTLYKTCLERQRQVLGEEHPDTQKTIRCAKLLQEKAG